MSTDTYIIQDSVMSINEWITELDGKFNSKEYNTLPEDIDESFDNSGKNNPFYGKKHTPECLKMMSKSQTGRTHSEETKRKIGLAQRGKVISDETKKKMRTATLGFRHTEETKERIGYLAKNISDKTRKKMSESRKGKIPWNKGLKLV